MGENNIIYRKVFTYFHYRIVTPGKGETKNPKLFMRWKKMKKILGLIVMVLLLFVSRVSAMERFEIVPTNQMKKMLDHRAAGKKEFILVNALDEIIFRHSAIPGSVNIPWSRVNELQQKLGKDKDKLIITYCMGYR